MAKPILKTPRVAVIVDNEGELLEYLVQTDNRDAIAWDMHRNRQKWPAGPDAPVLWMTFLAWSAMRRDPESPAAGLSFDDFTERVLSVAAPDGDDPEAAEPVDPTTADRVPA